MDPSMREPVSILIGALGGQGGGVLAEWLVDAATRAGYVAQSTSIPGVAQRTGATTYYVEVHPQPQAELGGRVPILGLYPVPGRVDLVIASELLEAGRILQGGYVSADRTRLIASTSRTLTTAEKMAMGDGRFSTEHLLDAAQRCSRQLDAFDMDAAARDAGTVVGSVMLGAIAGSGVLPVARTVFEAVVRAGELGVDASLRGFERGHAAVAQRAPQETPPAVPPIAPSGGAASVSTDARRVADAFPAGAREIIAAGFDRVVEFQDLRYGRLYVERLRAVDRAERACDPAGREGARVLREAARFLALWMAFDDVVRVASLKCRASRFARVRREIGAAPGDVVHVVDHFKPGVPELAGLLPQALARRLIAWDRRRRMRGREPLAWPLHLRSHTIHGFLLLRSLAALRRLRRLGARYQEEQRGIERWLATVAAGCAEDPALGHEIALCGRLIKGYGATNERGKANLGHILEHLVGKTDGTPATERAAAIRRAREAALADEGGKALDAELARSGVPPRPPIAQPIQWLPRRSGATQPE
ncbi:MAG TPA: indolepyruvate oxidoreductase subunit beta family protein, partial [Ideonella sp.]|nr:indolepyruvate oxidoreductase subunit beta family protein [Ideonella sp.]